MSETPDREDLHRELSDWLDGVGRAADSATAGSASQRDVARELVVHGLMSEMATRDAVADEKRIQKMLAGLDRYSVTNRMSPAVVQWIVTALAACILIAVGAMMLTSPDTEPQLTGPPRIAPGNSTFASVTQSVDANFGPAPGVVVGDRLAAQAIKLESGFLRLTFDDGVEVTLQGPAHYELIETGRTRLKTGLLTATVPAGAEGFTVDTPTAEVVDLGTSFGIELRDGGASHVSVFEGEVEVFAASAGASQLLRKGDAVRVPEGGSIDVVEFDPEPFTRVWPVASGIVRSTETFHFVPPWPPHRFIRRDDVIFIEPEGYGVELKQSLKLNISTAGEYTSENELTPTEVAAGERIRCFQAFFHPEQAVPLRTRKVVRGSVTFDSPVLGLIVLEDELQSTARRFSRKGPRDIRKNRELELTGAEGGDVVVLSEDRHTVTLELNTPSRFAELLRIVVDASRPPAISGEE